MSQHEAPTTSDSRHVHHPGHAFNEHIENAIYRHALR
jgi:hypothetical protein